MNQKHCGLLVLLTVLICGLITTGCQLGPAALKVSQTQYNEAIQRSSAEQLLLNLVRLKYRESPVFLEVGSVSAQFVFDQSGNLTGTLNENIGLKRGNPDVLQIGGRIGYTERPTITFVPLSGDQFVQQLLSPIKVETIVLLTHSGWRLDRVLRLTVQEMNGLDNAQAASGPTPSMAPQFRNFVRAAGLLHELRGNSQLQLERENRATPVSDAIPARLMTAEAVIEASKTGTRFRATEQGDSYVLTRDHTTLILRLSPDGNTSDAANQLRSLLQLATDNAKYDLVPVRKIPNGTSDTQPLGTDIVLDARSLLGVMFYLSQSIEVPLAHRQANIVTHTTDENGEPFDWSIVYRDLFKIYSQRKRPDRAVVAVRHRGYWFYIQDNDLTSKSTFALLAQLFTLQAGSVSGVAPVLTLPVGG